MVTFLRRTFALSLAALLLTGTLAFAFPDNGVLETCTGADATSPPNANWTESVLSTDNGIRISNNQCETDVDATFGSAFWNASTFGPDAEAYFTITATAGTGVLVVYARIANGDTTTPDNYNVVALPGSSIIRIRRMDDGVNTILGADISQAIDADDKLGIRVDGDQICAWFDNDAAGWAELGCRTDATYTAAGNIGIGHNGTLGSPGEIDSIGGGTITAVPTRRPIAPIIFSRLDDLARLTLTFLEPSYALAQ